MVDRTVDAGHKFDARVHGRPRDGGVYIGQIGGPEIYGFDGV